MMTSRLSSIRRRWSLGSIPSILASEVSWPGPDAEGHPAPREVVEQHHAIGEDQRVVVGERGHPGAEAEVRGALRGGGDEHRRVGDDLPAGRVVLADPRLLVAEVVEVLHELEVAVQREGGVLVGAVERGEEDPEAHRPLGGDARAVGLGHSSRRSGCRAVIQS